MNQLTTLMKSTTNCLVLLTVVLFFIQKSMFGDDYIGFELFNWQADEFKPWQFLTHIFLHANAWHLAFNMIALWSFGNILERTWGKKNFLIFYLLCSVGAAIISQLVDTYLYSNISYGATVMTRGVVYGLFALVCPNFKITLLFLPIPIAAKYFVPVLLLIDLTAGITGFSIFGANIAHFAHIGGAIIGLLLVQLWLKQ